MRGKYVVIEGPDKVGKSTLITNLLERLGHNWLEFAEPTNFIEPELNGIISNVIKARLNANGKNKPTPRELAYLFAANRLEEKSYLSGALDDEINILSSRSMLSSVIYQGQHLGFDYVVGLNCKVLPADVTIVLFSSEEVLEGRLKVEKNPDFLERQSQKFIRTLYAKNSGIYSLCKPYLGDVYHVDASGTPEQLADTVEELLNTKFGW